MPIIGIGVDIVHLPRIAALFQRRGAKFPARILSADEQLAWKTIRDDSEGARFLAVRWGVKEAAYKALYPTYRATWKEFTYTSLANGQKPTLSFHPQALATTGLQLHVSVTHDGEYVFATVLAEQS